MSRAHNSTFSILIFCACGVFFVFCESRATGQLLVPAQIISATASSGTVNTNGQVYNGNFVPGLTVNSFTTGFNFTGDLFWNNVQTTNATLTMVVRANLDPAWAPQPMLLGAAMSGTFDVPGDLTPNLPDFVVNSFSLQTDIPGAPYPVATATVNGPFHGGQFGVVGIYSVGVMTSPFNYAYNNAFPFIDLTFTMNADGLSVPGTFRIDFPASATFLSVPEPSTLLIGMLGTMGLGIAVCNRRRRAHGDPAS